MKKKSLLTLFALCALTACGFEPLHGRAERASRTTQIESVDIVTDGTRPGQLLKAEIEDQVNPDFTRAEKLYRMTIHFTEVEISLFINPDGTSSRGDLQYASNYVLSRRSDGKPIDTGAITRVSSYNISESADYATYVSREDARRRGILELAQDYKLRLANLVGKLNTPNAVPTTVTAPAPAPIIHSEDNHENRSSGF